MAVPIQISSFDNLTIEDTVHLDITDTGNATTVEFVLESDPAITWWKALEIHSASDAIIHQVETQDDNHGPNSMTVPVEELRGARLVLAKAKVFGVHTGMYELRDMDRQAGKSLHFIWQRDTDSDGPVAGFFRDLGGGISQAADAVANAVETILNAIGEILADVVEWAGKIIAGAIDALGTALGGIPLIGPILRGLLHWISTVVSAAFDFVAMFFKAVFDLVGDVIGGVVRIIGGALGGLLAWDSGQVGSAVLQGLGDIGAGISGAVLVFAGKFLAYVQSIFFLQLGERTLTQSELELLRRVYRSSVAFTNIRIVQGLAGFYSLFGRAFTLGNTIYMQNTDPATNPNVLVHECCHVWQFQHFGTRYAMDSLWAQATMPTPYDWRIELANGHQRWQDFNREAQAQFLEDAWVEGDQIGGLAGNGVFYQDQPIGSDVEFIDDTTSHTSLAIEAITYVRSLVTFRLSGLF